MEPTRQLMHFSFHFAKYSGRLLQAVQEDWGKDDNRVEQTVVDIALIATAASNTLKVKMPLAQTAALQPKPYLRMARTPLHTLFEGCVDIAARSGKACDALDHCEEFDAIGNWKQVCVDALHLCHLYAVAMAWNLDEKMVHKRAYIAANQIH